MACYISSTKIQFVNAVMWLVRHSTGVIHHYGIAYISMLATVLPVPTYYTYSNLPEIPR